MSTPEFLTNFIYNLHEKNAYFMDKKLRSSDFCGKKFQHYHVCINFDHGYLFQDSYSISSTI